MKPFFALCTIAIAAVTFGCGKDDQGEWKPTGDGKTVVNSKTGEIISTASGLTVQQEAVRNAELNEKKENQKREGQPELFTSWIA